MNEKIVYRIGLAVAVALCAALFSPVLEALLFQTRHLEAMTRDWFALLCHQEPARSCRLFGVFLPVCARCTGLYTGFLVAWSLWRLVPEKRRRLPVSNAVLFIGIAPMCMDGVLNLAGIVDSPAHLRFLTGFMFSAVAARSLWPALLEAVSLLKSLSGKKSASDENAVTRAGPEDQPHIFTGEELWKGRY
ncbi:MAG: DUF2085 domain-containing protein [bacterium]